MGSQINLSEKKEKKITSIILLFVGLVLGASIGYLYLQSSQVSSLQN